mgnify:CR=1 FL=1
MSLLHDAGILHSDLTPNNVRRCNRQGWWGREQQLAAAGRATQRLPRHTPFVPPSCPPACANLDHSVLLILVLCLAVQVLLKAAANSRRFTVAVSDFGLSRMCCDADGRRTATVGTVRFGML